MRRNLFGKLLITSPAVKRNLNGFKLVSLLSLITMQCSSLKGTDID